MKKIIKYISVIAVAAMSAACMDLEPQNQLSDPQVWNKAENYTLFANQFYGYLRGFQPSGSVVSMNGLKDGPHSDLRSDLVCGQTVNIYSAGTNTIPATDADYNNLYNRIYRTNLLLARAGEYGLPMSEIGEAVGEAYFFRAYLHFELLQLYGDCILVQQPLDVTSGELYAARTPRLTVAKAIVADLKAAADLLPDTPSEVGRLGKDAAWAMLSRVALYEGTWQKFHVGKGSNTEESKALLEEAAKAAGNVMEAGHYQLFHSDLLGDGESYHYMFIIEDVQSNPANINKSGNTEYILSRRYHETLRHIEFNITVGTYNHGDQTPTSKWADMYRCQDGLPIAKSPLFAGRLTAAAEFSNRDNRMAATLMKPGSYNHWKQTRTDWSGADQGGKFDLGTNSGYGNYKWSAERECAPTEESYDWPVIRYAEVLLNYAEAKFEADDAISNADLDLSLNLVRARCNPMMTKLSNELVAGNGLDMREEIRAERTVELVLEGFRIDDLKRWKTAEIEMPMDQTGVLYRGTEYESSLWTNCPKPITADGRVLLFDGRRWADKNYLYPLPSDQLQLNPALGQNPGWN